MKFRFIMPAIGLLLMLGACSSEEPQPAPTDPDQPILAEGDTYLAFSMTSGSRATDDPYASEANWDSKISTDSRFMHVFITPEGGARTRIDDVIPLRMDRDNVKLYCNVSSMIQKGTLLPGSRFRIDVIVNATNSNGKIQPAGVFSTTFTYQFMMAIDSNLTDEPVMPMYGFADGLTMPLGEGQVFQCNEQLTLLRAAHCIEVISLDKSWDFGSVPVLFGTNQLCFTGYVCPLEEKCVGSTDKLTAADAMRKNANLLFASRENLNSDCLTFTDKFSTIEGENAGYRIYLPEQESAAGNTSVLRVYVQLKDKQGRECTGSLYMPTGSTTFKLNRNYKTRFIIRSAEPDRGVGYHVEIDDETNIPIPDFS